MDKEHEMIKSKAILLNGYVAYSDDAIVSKTIVDRKTGIITLFAFDKGQKLSEHTTPYDALVHILDGEAELVIGGETLQVSSGKFVIMPANIPHAVTANQRFKMLLIMIR